jgi:putative YjhG/YagF family dehydratase
MNAPRVAEPVPLEALDPAAYDVITKAPGPAGSLPLDPEFLRAAPSGELFGLTQSAGMGWPPEHLRRPAFLILSTLGGLRESDGTPAALGLHVGHWELGELVREAAREFASQAAVPFAAYVTDPCDGRTQGTAGMMDSLAYRNDAALVFERLIRSLPVCTGVLAIATCDKGLPAVMMALAAQHDLPVLLVPGGVTLPAEGGEDAGRIQSIGARYAQGEISLEQAAREGCRACASPGGGCQFLGTAATSQVVAEALGLALLHTALAPSGQPIWRDGARRSARALTELARHGMTARLVLTEDALHNALAVHAAFGGSTNLLLHLPAIAHAAGLPRPTVADWDRANRSVPRLVDVLPNGPVGHPTVRVFLAGGVPEVMLHLRDLGLLRLDALTAHGRPLGEMLDAWPRSERRKRLRERLYLADGVDPDRVILPPAAARRLGLTSTVAFLSGNLAPEGAVIKSTALDPALVGPDGVFRHTGPARVFTREPDAIAAIKAGDVHPGDVLVLIGRGPLGAGMEETYQLTSALKHLSWGRHVALLTDARFSGVSTGACVGHVAPEALAGGPLARLRDGDRIRLIVDCARTTGCVDVVGCGGREGTPEEARAVLDSRPPHPQLAPDPRLPDATRLWAALQDASGGASAGCVYDVDRIVELLNAGKKALRRQNPPREG